VEQTWREQAEQIKRVKIMLVDDSAKVREMIKSLMVGLGAEFVECDNGGEALAAYRDRRPDWVLMDLMMPDVDGLTATRQIIGAFPGARVLVVTQFEGEHLRAAARDAGAWAYLLKDNLLEARQLIEAEARRYPEACSHTKSRDT